MNAGAIEPLVWLLRDGSPEAASATVQALFSLACNADIETLIAKAGGIEPLV